VKSLQPGEGANALSISINRLETRIKQLEQELKDQPKALSKMLSPQTILSHLNFLLNERSRALREARKLKVGTTTK
jgi:hypothetical protein